MEKGCWKGWVGNAVGEVGCWCSGVSKLEAVAITPRDCRRLRLEYAVMVAFVPYPRVRGPSFPCSFRQQARQFESRPAADWPNRVSGYIRLLKSLH
jgi:hypothetical protein